MLTVCLQGMKHRVEHFWSGSSLVVWLELQNLSFRTRDSNDLLAWNRCAFSDQGATVFFFLVEFRIGLVFGGVQ
jgi:hypothetical protein